jgi:hypothetical protein
VSELPPLPPLPDCPLCEEELLPEEAAPDTRVNGLQAHADCLLRTALGGWGHLQNHSYWCKERGDTDAGLSLRESARRVAQHFRENGFPK